MNREKKIKLFLGSAYILIVFVFLMIFFNNFSFQDFSSYELIRQNREALENIKNGIFLKLKGSSTETENNITPKLNTFKNNLFPLIYLKSLIKNLGTK